MSEENKAKSSGENGLEQENTASLGTHQLSAIEGENAEIDYGNADESDDVIFVEEEVLEFPASNSEEEDNHEPEKKDDRESKEEKARNNTHFWSKREFDSENTETATLSSSESFWHSGDLKCEAPGSIPKWEPNCDLRLNESSIPIPLASPIETEIEVIGNAEQPRDFIRGYISYNRIKRTKNSFDRIVHYVKEGFKIMVLVRGCTGSGKTTLANKIFQACRGGEGLDERFFIHSTDNYFTSKKDGSYHFNRDLLSNAHCWNQANVMRVARAGLTPIIVDNTFTQAWEMKAYVAVAVSAGYDLEIIEPDTYWAFSLKELVKRNVHGVKKYTLKSALQRYEHDITPSSLMGMFNLRYTGTRLPPCHGCTVICDEKLLEELELALNVGPEMIEENGGRKQGEEFDENFKDDFSDTCPGKVVTLSDLEEATVSDYTGSAESLLHPSKRVDFTEDLPVTFIGGGSSAGCNEEKGWGKIKGKEGDFGENYFAADSVEMSSSSLDASSSLDTSSSDANATEGELVGKKMKISGKGVDNNLRWQPGKGQSPALIIEEGGSINRFVNILNEDSVEREKNVNLSAKVETRLHNDLSVVEDEKDCAEDECVYEEEQEGLRGFAKLVKNCPESSDTKNMLNSSGAAIRVVNNIKVGTEELRKTPNAQTCSDMEDTFTKIENVLVLDAESSGLMKKKNNVGSLFDFEHYPPSTSKKGVFVDRYTMTCQTDNLNECVTLSCQKRDINKGNDNTAAASLPRRWEAEKGVMTDYEEFVRKAKPSLEDLELNFSKHVAEYVHDIFDNCQGNVEWIAELLAHESEFLTEKQFSFLSHLPPAREASSPVAEEEISAVSLESFKKKGRCSKSKGKKNTAGECSTEEGLPSREELQVAEEEIGVCPVESCKKQAGRRKKKKKTTGECAKEERIPAETSSEETVLVHFDPSIIVQLEHHFGSPVFCKGELNEFQAIVNLPVSFARKLQAYIYESLVNQEEQLMDLSADSEGNLAKSEEEGETVLSPSRSADSYASKISFKKLCDSFPTLDKRVIEETFKVFNFSYEETLEALRNYGTEEVSTPCTSKEAGPSRCDVEEKNTPEALVNSIDSCEYYESKLKNFQESCLGAAQKKLYPAVGFYREEAGRCKAALERLNAEAAISLTVSSGNSCIDLHYLTVKEALHALDVFLDVKVARFKSQRKCGKCVIFVITGRGSRSKSGCSHLKPPVLKRMNDRRVQASESEKNPGMIKGVINIHSLLSNASYFKQRLR